MRYEFLSGYEQAKTDLAPQITPRIYTFSELGCLFG